jgi:hypothetical protein
LSRVPPRCHNLPNKAIAIHYRALLSEFPIKKENGSALANHCSS